MPSQEMIADFTKRILVFPFWYSLNRENITKIVIRLLKAKMP